MKILQILYSLSPGGAERLVVDLSNELSNKGHDVTLCVLLNDTNENFGFYKSEVSQKINYVNLNASVGFKLKNIGLLFKLIKKINPQIVHCHLNLVNYLFPIIFIFPKVKFYHTIHSDAKREVKSILEYWLRRIFYTNHWINAVTISAETSQSFKSYYRTSPSKEIRNGRANPTKKRFYFENIKEIQGFKDKGYTIFLHVGRYNIVKNQEMLINVFNRLINEGEKVVLLIVGAGFDSIEGLKLKGSAGNNIIFLGEKKDVSDYYLNADAFCLSSTHEGLPMSLIEALSYGCVPICTPVGGIINTIEYGITGYLSDTILENDYYNTILHYLLNKDQIKRNDLINYFYLNYNIEKCASEYLLLFQSSD